MDFTDELKTQRPHLSAGSLKTYNSLLRSLYKNVFGNDEKPNVKNFNKTETIIEFLNTKPYNVRKTILSSLMCISPNDDYKTLMLEDINTYNKEVKKMVMNDKQKKSNISTDEVTEKYNELKDNAEMLYKKKHINENDLQRIQDFIIVSLLGGIHIVPRRSLDYISMKIRNVDKTKDNYIEKNNFVFNQYKTQKFYGKQELPMTPLLKKIITKWISIIPTPIDTLLFNANFEPLINVTLNQRLNRLLGKGRAVNQMRHTYLTDKYSKVMEAQKEMANDMSDMGSSEIQAPNYIKLK
jgi:hypothetical protein